MTLFLFFLIPKKYYIRRIIFIILKCKVTSSTIHWLMPVMFHGLLLTFGVLQQCPFILIQDDDADGKLMKTLPMRIDITANVKFGHSTTLATFFSTCSMT